MRRTSDWPRPLWRGSVHDYGYMSTLAKQDWAWECLRRNTTFRSVARLWQQRGLIRVRLGAGPILTRLRARLPHAEAWGLCCFFPPDLTAAETYPVWLPEIAHGAFRVTAANVNPPLSHTVGLHFPTLPNVGHILLDAAGRQHVVLRIREGTYQLTIAGAHGPIAPVAISLLLENQRDIAVSARHLTKLNTLLASPDAPTNPVPRWSAQTKRWRDALIAVDGRRAGATFREIAAVIYGRERVEHDWPGTGLKVRVHRDFQRGLALCNGGYRDLLAEG